MNFTDAVKAYFLKWNDFRSRSSRSEYWWATLFVTLASFPVGFIIGFVIAILTIGDIWTPDKEKEAQQIYQTTDIFHPGVNTLLNETHSTYVGGTLKGIHYPKHYDYPQLRHTPQELRESFDNWGWKDIIAFQTRNPMHRAHIELTKRALNEKNPVFSFLFFDGTQLYACSTSL